MRTKEILQKTANKNTTDDLLKNLRLNNDGLNYYTKIGFRNIEIKNKIAEIIASNSILIQLIDIKEPGFIELIEKNYDDIISDY